MKKLLVLLTLFVSVFCFSTGAFAQVVLLPVASTCSATVPRLDCSLPGQNGVCHAFDFETGLNELGSQEICDTKSYSNKAIFAICNCPDTATNFKAGSKIGVRMTILVNDQPGQRGAYWSLPSNEYVNFGKATTKDLACLATLTDSFGMGHYYKSPVDLTKPIPLYGGTACDVPTVNEATVYVTDRTAGYTITLDDEINALNYWQIDIPFIRIDRTILHNGETIKVKVEFLNQDVGRGICSDCPPICEGTITVAKVCCDESSTCFFPYFTSISAPDDATGQFYWNGISIINNSGVAGVATFTAHEQGGGIGTFETPLIQPGSMFVTTLDQIQWTGTLLGGLRPIFIDVTTNMSMIDGFAMMADSSTGESMGYLCRKPETVRYIQNGNL